jgi:DNA topoisomerase I
MNEGDTVRLTALRAEQHFTEPPPRFSEASLVKALEEHGIGRPSTYASIISTLQDREYVEMDNRRFIPTDIGKIVNRFLTLHFNQYVQYNFTADMEDELDAVSRGEEEWITPLAKFWAPFIKQVEDIEKNVSRDEVAQAREVGVDPVSGKPMTVRMGRFGPFVQIGTKDDEEKPKFAGLRPGQKMDSITHEQALELFKLPRTLGSTAEGAPIVVAIGRFGPYIKFGEKYVSLKDDDPYTVSLERAIEVIRLKQEADANRLIQDFGVDNIQVLNGRYGPYITDKLKNARMPKDRDPKTLTLEECRALLAAAPARGNRFGRGRRGAAGKAAAKPAAATAAKAKSTKAKSATSASVAANGDGAKVGKATPAKKSVAKKKKKKAAAAGTQRAAIPKVEA